MIKILRHGHAQYKMTCKYCECVFTFEDSDIECNNNQRDYSEWIFCPECGRANYISNRQDISYKLNN